MKRNGIKKGWLMVFLSVVITFSVVQGISFAQNTGQETVTTQPEKQVKAKQTQPKIMNNSKTKASNKVFKPSEEISEDVSVDFPVDI